MSYQTGNYLGGQIKYRNPIIYKHYTERVSHTHYRTVEKLFEFTLIYGLLIAGLGTVALVLSR